MGIPNKQDVRFVFHIYLLKYRSKRNTSHWKSKCRKRLSVSLTPHQIRSERGPKRIQSRYNLYYKSHKKRASNDCACLWLPEVVPFQEETGCSSTKDILLKRGHQTWISFLKLAYKLSDLHINYQENFVCAYLFVCVMKCDANQQILQQLVYCECKVVTSAIWVHLKAMSMGGIMGW